MAHPPHHISPVIGDEQRAIGGDGDADRAAIDGGVSRIGDEAGQEVLRIAARLIVLEGHEDDLVAVEARAVPRAVQADERAVAVLLRK